MPVSKSTENEITYYLAQILAKKVPKTYPFRTIETPNGRREVDIISENGGVYLLEAKYTENELLEAIGKIQNDYLKYYKILGINGGFALLYPEELKKPMPPEKLKALLFKLEFLLVCQFPPEDKRPFTKIKGNINEICDKLAEIILQPLKPIEPDVEFTIKILKKSTKYIVESLRELTETELKKFFGGEKIFKHILPTEERKIPLENLREGVAYILLTQLLFYHILSKIRKDLPEIDSDKINHPKDLDSFFDKLVEKTKDYKSIFSYKISELLPYKEDTLRKVKDLINVINGLTPEKIGGDLLGTIFHDLVPFEVRKAVAAYYTNVLAAELLAWLSIDNYNARVIDLAVGSGGLLVSAYRRKKYLAGDKFNERIHKEFVQNHLYGIDIMPFAATIAASHLALQCPHFFTQKVNIGIWDSTELKPGIKIPTIATTFKRFLSKTIDQKQLVEFGKVKGQHAKITEKRAVEITEFVEEIELNKVDVVIMNPPFTRQERIPKEYKEILEERFKDYKTYLRGQMSYFGYFIFLADKFLDEGGKLAFVLPATFLSKKHSEGVRKFLADNYFVEYIILNQERLSFSESTLFREILLVARKTKDNRGKTKIVFLKHFPKSLEESRKIADVIKHIKEEYEDDRILIKNIDYQILKKNIQNWYKWLIYSPILEFANQIFSSNKLQLFMPYIKYTLRLDLDKLKLGDFHAFILYNKDRALKRYDLWTVKQIEKDRIIIKHKILNKEIELPSSILTRGLRRHTNVRKMDVSKVADFVICRWNDKIKEIAQYLLTQKQLKKIDRELISSWKKYIGTRESNLLILRRPFIASPGTSCLAFFSKEKIIGINMWHVKSISNVDDAKILCLWLNSSLSLLQLFGIGIASEGNWTKIDEYMLSQLYVPNFKNLQSSEKEKLLNLFEKVKSKNWDSMLEQFINKDEDRYEIDKTFLEILGFKEDEIEKILDKVYNIILGELKSLSSTTEIETE